MQALSLRQIVTVLVLLFASLLGLGFFSGMFDRVLGTTPAAQPLLDKNGTRIPPPRPAPRPEDYVAAQPTHGFQLLVSYVGSGFEPSRASIKSGDTIRFTNNSREKLWVAAAGDHLYPAMQNGCGSSALDSCRALSPGEYWEFTFDKIGTWMFQNNLDKGKTGTVEVIVK